MNPNNTNKFIRNKPIGLVNMQNPQTEQISRNPILHPSYSSISMPPPNNIMPGFNPSNIQKISDDSINIPSIPNTSILSNNPEQLPLPRFDLSDFPVLGSAHQPQVGPISVGKVSNQNNPNSNIDSIPLSYPNPNDINRFQMNDFPSLIPPSHPNLSVPKINTESPLIHHFAEEEFPALGSGSVPIDDKHFSSNKYSSNHVIPTSSDKYTLKGLLNIIRMTDPDLNILALGTDLTTLGLNLNSAEALFPTFNSPWSESIHKEHDFFLPYCYYMQPPALKTSHLAIFQLETLFYIFYSLPRDTLQVYAAKELYNREWKYHKELKLWFRLNQNRPNPNINSYIYFDIYSWEKRIFPESSTQNLVFMNEGEIRNL